MKPIVSIAVTWFLFLGLSTLEMTGQNQPASSGQSSAAATASDTSLGSYARQIRKNTPNTGKAKVFDNDNLPKEDALSIVGTPAGSGDNASQAKTEDSSAPAEGSTQNKSSSDAKPADQVGPASPPADQAEKEAAAKQWDEKLSKQKDAIDLLSRELDVLQKEYQLRAAAFYADAGNRLRNEAAWDQEDAKYKQQIADKQKALEDAKQQLDDLQEQARKAGMPSSVSQQ
jgi:hypothetical protein